MVIAGSAEEGTGPVRIAVLGGGVMGRTLATGFLRRTPRPTVVVAERRAPVAQELRADLGVEIDDAAAAVVAADVVVLATKPQDVAALLADVGGLVRPDALVVSIAAGVSIATIERALPAGVGVVRAMPNTPARIDRGVTGLSPGPACRPDQVDLARDLLGSVGIVVDVAEDLQDAVTALSGSGPAYVFYLAEAMTAAGVDLGLDEAIAVRMATETILGAAALLSATGEPAGELRRQVTSPGGTTAAAVAVLDDRDVAASVRSAIAAARDRARELAGG